MGKNYPSPARLYSVHSVYRLIAYGTNDAAADFFSGITGGLCGEVVSLGMNDDGTVKDFFYGKALIVKRLPGITLIAEQWGQVAGVIRVLHTGGVVVVARFVKGKCAVAKFMDMHSIEIAGAAHFFIWKTEDFYVYKCAAIGGLIETC